MHKTYVVFISFVKLLRQKLSAPIFDGKTFETSDDYITKNKKLIITSGRVTDSAFVWIAQRAFATSPPSQSTGYLLKLKQLISSGTFSADWRQTKTTGNWVKTRPEKSTCYRDSGYTLIFVRQLYFSPPTNCPPRQRSVFHSYTDNTTALINK